MTAMAGERGPDLVIAGAARSGTTMLASLLARHPNVVLPRIKEPNFFSSNYANGFGWYLGLFERPAGGGLLVDASTQYTFPRFMHRSFERLCACSDPFVVYVVREPIERAFSHFVRTRFYEDANRYGSFSEALSRDSDILGASKYDEILECLGGALQEDRLLIVPFELITRNRSSAFETVMQWAGIDTEDAVAEDSAEILFQNESAVIKNKLAKLGFKYLRDTRLYPRIRSIIGPERVRRIRARITTSDGIPTLKEGLTSCSRIQRDELATVSDLSRHAVASWLEAQDERLGLSLSQHCSWTR